MPLASALALSNQTLKRNDKIPKIALECIEFIEKYGTLLVRLVETHIFYRN